jgi:hypothetical protein
MDSTKTQKGDALAWLLEPTSPGVRYLALRDLVDCPADSRELAAARRAAYRQGPIATILDEMNQQGYWVAPGPGYNPKYTSTVWSVLALAQLGASITQDERIERACDYLVEHALTSGGQFTASGAPSGTADCLQGELCWALLALGYEEARLEGAFEWMARTVTGEGMAPASERSAPVRYYAGKCGPRFACGANNRLPCAWGAVKVMLAFGELSPRRRTPLIKRAIAEGVDFLLDVDPVTAAYPSGYSSKPSGNWWRFGFPMFYVTDILELALALVNLGLGRDRRLANTLERIRQKQDAQGRWSLEYDYSGKTWVDWGAKKQPNKWVTFRALQVLKDAQARA